MTRTRFSALVASIFLLGSLIFATSAPAQAASSHEVVRTLTIYGTPALKGDVAKKITAIATSATKAKAYQLTVQIFTQGSNPVQIAGANARATSVVALLKSVLVPLHSRVAVVVISYTIGYPEVLIQELK